MSPQDSFIFVLIVAFLIVAFSVAVELRIRSSAGVAQVRYERLLRQRRLLRITQLIWVGIGFLVVLWGTYFAPGRSVPGPNPEARPGEPLLIGVFFFTFLVIAAWVICGYWMSAIVSRRFPGAPVLDSERIWDLGEKLRQSREFDRFIAEEGSRRDPLLAKLHRADRVLLRTLGAAAAVFAIMAAFVYWPF
jgi:hypothetical protein